MTAYEIPFTPDPNEIYRDAFARIVEIENIDDWRPAERTVVITVQERLNFKQETPAWSNLPVTGSIIPVAPASPEIPPSTAQEIRIALVQNATLHDIRLDLVASLHTTDRQERGGE